MKYVKVRGNKYYYKRRIPLQISNLVDVKFINRPLYTDKKLSLQLASRYDNIFTMIDVGLKLNKDVTELINELNIQPITKIDIYKNYLKNQNVSENRLTKIKRLLLVIKILLPSDISKINMTVLDDVKNKLTQLPKRNIQKYRELKIQELVKMDIPIQDRLSTESINDHLKILNSLIKFGHERDMIARQYAVSMIKNVTMARDERTALSIDVIKNLIGNPATKELASAYTLLYLSGMRLSESFKCTISVVDGIKCFDLTNRAIQLKTKSSYRLVPIHHSIENPELILEDLRSMRKEYIGRLCKKTLGTNGTLYSLRHSFATHMAAKGVEPYIISELLGHSHSGMTLGRYVKGFDVKILKNAIDKLEIL